MTTKKIATSTFWQLGSQAVTMVLGILSIKFVTTALSQSLVGNYQTVYAYLQIFGILADFGLYAVAVRELSRAPNRIALLGSLFVLRACITAVSLGTAIIIAFVIPSFSGTPLPLGIVIASFVPFFTLLGGMLRTLFQVEYKMQYVFISEVISKAIPVCLLGSVVILGHRLSESLTIYYSALAFGGLGSLCFFLLLMRFTRGLPTVCTGLLGVCQTLYQGFSWDEFKRLLKLSAPFGLAFFMTTIYRQSDVTLIAVLRPDYDIQNAYYGTVLRLAEIGFLLPTFILNSALPIMSKRQQAGEDMSHFLGTILLGLLTLGSVVSLFAFVWAKPIVLLVTRDAYLSTASSPGSDTALQLLSFSMFLSMIVAFCFYILLNRGSWRALLIVTSGAAILSVTFNMVLIPLFGFVGAGMTSIFVHLYLALALCVATVTRVHVDLRFTQVCQWFAYSLTIGLTLFATLPYLTNSVVTLFAGVVGVIISCALLLVFKLVPAGVLPVRR